MEKTKPAYEIRMGVIKAAIWKNGSHYHVTVSRLYKDNGDWKYSENFRRDDLLVLAKVVDLAHTWIYQQD